MTCEQEIMLEVYMDIIPCMLTTTLGARKQVPTMFLTRHIIQRIYGPRGLSYCIILDWIKKLLPPVYISYGKLLYKVGHYFLDIQ